MEAETSLWILLWGYSLENLEVTVWSVAAIARDAIINFVGTLLVNHIQ
jgi:hypothetical protein